MSLIFLSIPLSDDAFRLCGLFPSLFWLLKLLFVSDFPNLLGLSAVLELFVLAVVVLEEVLFSSLLTADVSCFVSAVSADLLAAFLGSSFLPIPKSSLTVIGFVGFSL